MAAIDEIKSRIDISQVAGMLGVDASAAETAVDSALGALLDAVGGRTDDSNDVMNLANALTDHVGAAGDPGQVDLSAIDQKDGKKIVGHLLEPDQIQQLSSDTSGGLVEKLMPYLAPLVMEYLADSFNGYLKDKIGLPLPSSGRGGKSASTGVGGVMGGILDQLLGNILGGSKKASADKLDTTFSPPKTKSSGGKLRVDVEAPAEARTQQSKGNILGSILQDLLFGR